MNVILHLAVVEPPDKKPDKTTRSFKPGTHILGEHVWIVIDTGLACQPSATAPAATRPLIVALGHGMDLCGAGIAAVRPSSASPEKPHIANRDRSSTDKPLPMNPVQHHHASGGHRAPTGQLDSDYWVDQHDRVHDHWDRCEVVRRAARHLASLLRPDPHELSETEKRKKMGRDPSVEEQVLIEGKGWPLIDVARRFHLTPRAVAVIRINAKHLRHPLTGHHWKPPAENALAALEARAMKAEGLTSTDIALALDRSANTVRAWTTSTRRAA